MARFKDAKGREWTLLVTTGSIKRVRAACEVDLADVETAATRLSDDPVLLVDVLWVLCKYQAEHLETPVNDVDFGESLVGDPIEDATVALQEAIASFFPASKRLLLQKATAKTAAARGKAEKLAMAKLDDPELDAKLEQAMETRMETDLQSALTRLPARLGTWQPSGGNDATKLAVEPTPVVRPRPQQFSVVRICCVDYLTARLWKEANLRLASLRFADN